MHNIGYLVEKENCNKSKVMTHIMEIAERDGDGYDTGQMHWHDRQAPLKNRDEAEKFIKDHDRGWYDDHAVKFYCHDNVKTTKKMTEIRERIKSINLKRDEYTRDHSVKKLKAAFVSCPKCGSKLAREKLWGEQCPLCRTDLRSKTTLDTLKRYQERIDEEYAKLKAEQEKQQGEICWLIKYEYHS